MLRFVLAGPVRPGQADAAMLTMPVAAVEHARQAPSRPGTRGSQALGGHVRGEQKPH